MFEPINALETLMQSAAANPAKILDFYRALLDSDVYILTPEAELELGGRRSLKPNEVINIATVEFQGKQWHPAFTAPARVFIYLKESETCLEAKARDLFSCSRRDRTSGSTRNLNVKSRFPRTKFRCCSAARYLALTSPSEERHRRVESRGIF